MWSRIHYVPLMGTVLAAAKDEVAYSMLFFGVWVVALIYGCLYQLDKE